MSIEYRLLDCDDDARDANGSDTWDSVEECLQDIRQALMDGDFAADYLPWRIVVYNEDKIERGVDLQVAEEIVSVDIRLVTKYRTGV